MTELSVVFLPIRTYFTLLCTYSDHDGAKALKHNSYLFWVLFSKAIILWRRDPLVGKHLETNEYSRCYAIDE
jgi:hypothetical protein